MKNKTGKAVAGIIAVPVGLCTCKVAMDIATNLLPPAVGTPLKIAYKVGTFGIGMLGDYAITKIVSDAVDEVCDAVEEVEEAKKEAQKQTKKHLKEVGA